MKRIYLLLLFCLAATAGAWAQACTGIPIVPSQDCPNAIPLCGLRYTYPTGAICGPGNIEDELPTGSCLASNERNTTWYVFKVRKSGLLKYAILPLDDSLPDDSGDMDYDWGLFKLPAGAINTTAICSQLHNNLTWQVSCNYSAERGATGMLDTGGMEPTNTQGAAGSKWNQPIFVNRDEVYVLAVDNFTGGDLIGYTIRFRDTLDLRTPDDHNQGIADITPAGNLPHLDSVLRAANCLNPGTLFSFNKDIVCASVQDGDITVVNLAHPEIIYDIDSVYPQACIGGSSQNWIINFSPVAIDTNYAIVIRDSIIDICGKVLVSDTLRFRVNPFVRLESYVQDVQQDTVCSGSPIEVRAIPDENLHSRISDFTYTWFVLDSATGAENPVISTDSFLVDTNIITVTQHFPVKTKIIFIVEARGVNTSCADRDTMTIRIDPLPVAPVVTPVTACYGSVSRVSAGNLNDSIYYTYKWTSQVAVPHSKVPQAAYFDVLGDTLNISNTKFDSVQVRGQNDVYKVTVTYKPQYGGCEGKPQTSNLYVGKYLRPYFVLDSIIRPGKNGYFVLDTNTFFNLSYLQTKNQNRMATERWDFGDSTIVSQAAISDTIKHVYTAPGQYRITLYLVDSLIPGVYCTQSYSKLVEFVPSKWESGRRGEIGFIPNVVTPNNDGKNDYLEFIGVPVDGYQLEVYNRWGKKVFSANPYNNTWIPSDIERGTYFFRLKRVAANLPATAKDEYKGWFEVIY